MRAILLIATLSILNTATMAQSTASVTRYVRKEGESMVQVISRRGGGSYAVFAINSGSRILPLSRYPFPITATTGGTNAGGDIAEGSHPDQIREKDTAANRAGGIVLGVATDGNAPLSQFRIVRLDADGKVLGETTVRTNNHSMFQKAVAAPDGGLYVVGYTLATNFPVIRPALPNPYTGDPLERTTQLTFILKMTPGGTAIERSTLLGGVTRAASPGAVLIGVSGSIPQDVAVDGSGNVYITGATSRAGFPVSANASKPDPKLETPYKYREGFLMKLDGGLSRMIYSTFFGSDEASSAACPTSFGTTGLSVRVVGNGEAVVYATTTGKPIPSTPGAYDARDPANGVPRCSPIEQPGGSSFVLTAPTVTLLRFNSTGSAIVNAARVGRSVLDDPQTNPLQVSPDGSLLVALNANQTEFGNEIRFLRLDGSLSTALGTNGLDVANDLAQLRRVTVQNDGTIWAAGTVALGGGEFSDRQFPDGFLGAPPTTNLGNEFLLQLDPSSLKTQRRWMLPAGMSSASLRTDEFNVKPSFAVGLELSLPASGNWQPAILGITNSAGTAIQDTVTPYELLSIYGAGLSAGESSGTTFDRNGALPTLHNGTSVLVNGTLSPLLYVGSSQINLIVPASVADLPEGSPVSVQLAVNGKSTQAFSLSAKKSNINVFSGAESWDSLPSLAFNPDGSSNSIQSPILAGEQATVYLNGLGAPADRIEAGRRVNGPLGWPGYSVRVTRHVQTSSTAEGEPVYEYQEVPEWSVGYFGAAPGAAPGMLQVKVQTPKRGNRPSNITTVSVQVVYLEFRDSRGPQPQLIARTAVVIWTRNR